MGARLELRMGLSPNRIAPPTLKRWGTQSLSIPDGQCKRPHRRMPPVFQAIGLLLAVCSTFPPPKRIPFTPMFRTTFSTLLLIHLLAAAAFAAPRDQATIDRDKQWAQDE